jgi:MYND finger
MKLSVPESESVCCVVVRTHAHHHQSKRSIANSSMSSEQDTSATVSGETLSEEAWFQGNQCAFCLVKDADSEVDLMRCGACKQTFYCSREHQRKDWPAHKVLCKKIRDGSVGKATQTLSLRACECNNHALADLSGYVHALNVRACCDSSRWVLFTCGTPVCHSVSESLCCCG